MKVRLRDDGVMQSMIDHFKGKCMQLELENKTLRKKFEKCVKAIQIEVMDQLVFKDEDTILVN